MATDPRDKTRQLSASSRDADEPRHCLVLYHRAGVKVAPLEPGKHVTVGRTAPADVVVADDSLSRQHARFLLLDGALLIEDLGSTNGTWVGGEALTTGTVAAGAEVLLGNVTAVLHVLGADSGEGVESHDEFLSAVEREHRRAQHFKRPFCVAMLAARDASDHIHDWLPALASTLRPVDRVALFGAGTLEILLPELDRPSALALIERVGQRAAVALACGVAAYPGTATSVDALLAASLGELERARRGEPGAGDDEARGDGDFPDSVIAGSASMREVIELARRVAGSTLPVLVHGETGSGKEVLCRSIHESGPRSGRAFVAVNCAAIPQQLVESTLFGHVKGAFTGATEHRVGLFEAADGGTLLLDEIGDLPLAVQATLLRVLESGAVMRVGATAEREVDVRVLAATHRDLEAMAERGEFRSDLFYRLNGVRLDIPPLRQRRSDIVPLAERFLAEACAGGAARALSQEAREALRRYAWPGNIRELKNTVRRAAVIARHDVIGLDDLPARVRQGAAVAHAVEPPAEGGAAPAPALLRDGESFRACLERLEAEVLREALAATGGNQSEAARRLDMPRRTLVHKIKTLGLRDD